MLKEELKENLGRIARSGTANFVEELGKGILALQFSAFGVGFYSAFLVANKVDVYSRSFKEESDGKTWFWSSTGPATVVARAQL
eukprot:s3132_g15.t1